MPGLPKSNAAPGVLGGLFTLPKLAKAPLPNPNADEAPELAVGEANDADAELPALKGLFLLFRLPKRLEDGVSLLSRLSLRSVLLVDRLILLLLLVACAISECRIGVSANGYIL